MARPDKSLRSLRLVLWGLVLLAGLGASWLFLIRAPQQQSAGIGTEVIGQGSYALAQTDGTPFTAETLRGAPSLVFFGFTHCPDVCPTTLADIATWQEISGYDIRTFLISVDPERDPPEVLADYISWLPGAIGVTGTPEALEQAYRDFRVVVSRVELEGGDYTMNHSAYVMLFDAEGRFSQIFSYQEDPEQAAARLARFMEAQDA